LHAYAWRTLQVVSSMPNTWAQPAPSAAIPASTAATTTDLVT
jgi:hypothetical protein